MQQKYFEAKLQAVSQNSFSYLDLFEQEMKQRNQAQNEFYSEKKEKDDDLEDKKPAMFRKEPQSSDP